jgi:Fe2+ or Zn2+ uptake regulation protein
MAGMEVDIGLDRFTHDEVDVICAIVEVSGSSDAPTVQLLREHPLCSRMSKPTLYRALARLVELQVIKRQGGERSGFYHVEEKAFSYLT